MRIITGIDFTMHESELKDIYIRVTCGVSKTTTRWGTLMIHPKVIFLTGDKVLPYIDTWFKPLYSQDCVKSRSTDPAFVDATTTQEDIDGLQQIYEAGELKDESKPIQAAEERECYEGTQFAKRGNTDKSKKNQNTLLKWNKMMEKERENIPVGKDDESTTSSQHHMKNFLNEDNIEEEIIEERRGEENEIMEIPRSRNSMISLPPNYNPNRTSDILLEKGKDSNDEEDNEEDHDKVVSFGRIDREYDEKSKFKKLSKKRVLFDPEKVEGSSEMANDRAVDISNDKEDKNIIKPRFFNRKLNLRKVVNDE